MISANSLPRKDDPSFRETLKAERESRGMTQYALAKAAGIAPVMIARYEDQHHKYATLPSVPSWIKLNEVLFEIEPVVTSAVPLSSATTEEIISELKQRGATTVVITW